MFRELRYTSRYIDEFNKVPLMPMNTLLGSSLSSWLVSDETLENNPAVMNLRQLRETCESLQTIEEILTVRANCLRTPAASTATDNHHHPRCTESIIRTELGRGRSNDAATAGNHSEPKGCGGWIEA